MLHVSQDERPKQLTPQPQPPTLQPWCCSLQHTLLKAAARPFSDPAYCSTGFLQAAVALLLPVALTPLGIALQLHSTPGFTAADRGPWAGVLYVAAAVPLLRLLAGPAAYVLFSLGEVRRDACRCKWLPSGQKAGYAGAPSKPVDITELWRGLVGMHTMAHAATATARQNGSHLVVCQTIALAIAVECSSSSSRLKSPRGRAQLQAMQVQERQSL